MRRFGTMPRPCENLDPKEPNNKDKEESWCKSLNGGGIEANGGQQQTVDDYYLDQFTQDMDYIAENIRYLREEPQHSSSSSFVHNQGFPPHQVLINTYFFFFFFL